MKNFTHTAAIKYFVFFLLVQSFSFSIAAQIADDLPRQGFLGAQVAPVPEERRSELKLIAEQGIVVMRVDAGSSAEAAGLKSGDVILKVGGTNVNSALAFVNLIRPFRAGQKVALSVLRDGNSQTIEVTLKPRPLETSPDFDVLYRAVDTKNGRRRVIITKPKTGVKLPAVLLVGGIGCYSLDNFAPSHAYRKILYGLTAQGFATMRVEKSGMGDSEGAPCQTVDLRQEIEGYVAGLRALKTYDFVDADRVFIFGHSIGGIVGPAVAAEEKTRGLIVSETVGTNWFEYALENFRRQALLRGESYDETEAGARLNQVCKRRLWIDKQSREQILKENPACGDFLQDPASPAYMQQLVELNLAETWKKVDAPTLIVYGSSDFLTSAKEHEYLRDMINKFRPGKAVYVEIPAMDHYFVQVATQSDSLRNLLTPPATPPPFVERALTEISNWLKQNLNNSQNSATIAASTKFTAAEFQSLRWLEGNWRGTENGQNPFYERYRFAGDDRLEMQSFKNPQMTEPGEDTSVTFFKDGAIYHQVGRAVWAAERLSKTEIAFAPKENARNSFVWKMESPDIWTAELIFTDRNGQTKKNVYRLERLKN